MADLDKSISKVIKTFAGTVFTASPIIDHSAGTGMSPEEASELARKLNSDPEDPWSYEVSHDPSGQGPSFVETYDEDGKYVGKL